MDQLFPFAESLTAIVLIILNVGYFIGAIPFGLLIAFFWLGIDIRQMGSGNIGATNVLRTGSKLSAIITLLLDAAKGAIPCLIILAIAPDIFAADLALLAGIAAVMGHMHPIWLNFRGGRGVATCLGMITVMHPLLALVFLGSWMVTAAITRYSSMASMLSMLLLSIITIMLDYDISTTFAYAMLTLLVVTRHSDNIKRLLAGNEPTIAFLSASNAAQNDLDTNDLDNNADSDPVISDPAIALHKTLHTASQTGVTHEPTHEQVQQQQTRLATEVKLMSAEDDWDDIPSMPDDLTPETLSTRSNPASNPPLNTDRHIVTPKDSHNENIPLELDPARHTQTDDDQSKEDQQVANQNASDAVKSAFTTIAPADFNQTTPAPPLPDFSPSVFTSPKFTTNTFSSPTFSSSTPSSSAIPETDANTDHVTPRTPEDETSQNAPNVVDPGKQESS